VRLVLASCAVYEAVAVAGGGDDVGAFSPRYLGQSDRFGRDFAVSLRRTLAAVFAVNPREA
jgi:hypothetical protein